MNCRWTVLWVVAIALLKISSGVAQTCCSGGVPLSGNLGLPASASGTVQLSLTYDLNVLETLKSGRRTLEDDSRSRRTHSWLLEGSYTFSDRFSVDAFFAYVRQEREIRQFGNVNFSATNGVGDAVLLLKYNLLTTSDLSTVWQVGAGPKIPLGPSDLVNDIGLALNADLQPGSGAWDAVFFSQFSRVTKFRPTLSMVATALYGLKGKNREYFGVQTYQFGNEAQVSVGVSDRLLFGRAIVDPSLTVQFRDQRADEIDGETLPSTGGSWAFLNPAVAWWVSPDWSLNIGASLPIFSSITGTQVTPTYRFNTGVFYRFATKNRKIIDFKSIY